MPNTGPDLALKSTTHQHGLPQIDYGERRLSNSALLAGAGAFLDAFTYMGHGHVFANAMTGNVVLLGINCISGSWQTSLRHLPPILTFLLGICAGRALQLPAMRRLLGHPYRAALVLEIAILAALVLLPAGTADFWFTTSIAFAASIQVETFREVDGHNYNSTFTTGNLRSLSEGVFDWCFRGHSPEAGNVIGDFALICVAFLVGATVGGYATGRFGNAALLMDIAVLGLVALRLRPVHLDVG